jgi:hypothetical protein
MPRPLTLGNLAKSGVETQRSAPEVADRQARSASSSRSGCRSCPGVRGAGGKPPRHLVQFGQQLAALVRICGAGLPGEGQSAQQPGQGGRVEAGGGR